MKTVVNEPVTLSSGTRFTILGDWRQLSYVERGAPDGQPVFVFHDLPGSRMQQHPDRALAARLGLRLIYTDRPGFGMSTVQLGRRFQHWAADLGQVADALNIASFGIAAFGGGAPYALACAAAMPQRVSRVAIAATYVPPEFMLANAHWRLRAKLTIVRKAPILLRGLLKKNSFRARRDPYHYLDRWAHHLGALDTEVLTNLPLLGQYEQDTREAFRQSTKGLRAELHALAYPWKIAFNDIRCETRFWHGAQDRVVSIAAARRFVARLPQAHLHEIANAAHLVWYQQWPAMLKFLSGAPLTDSAAQQRNRLDA